MISITCPHCSYEFKASTEAIGHETKCPECGQSFVPSVAPPLPAQPDPELVLYPVAEPIPIRWNPIKIAAWLLLVFLALGALAAIAPLIDSFVRWTAYPNQKQDDERYKRMGDRIEAERAKSSRER